MALHLLFHTVEWMFYILGRFVADPTRVFMTRKSALVFPQTPRHRRSRPFQSDWFWKVAANQPRPGKALRSQVWKALPCPMSIRSQVTNAEISLFYENLSKRFHMRCISGLIVVVVSSWPGSDEYPLPCPTRIFFYYSNPTQNLFENFRVLGGI